MFRSESPATTACRPMPTGRSAASIWMAVEWRDRGEGRASIDARPSPRSLHSTALQIDAADLPVGIGRHAVVAGDSDRNIQLVVGTETDELPAVRLLLRQIVVDHDRLRRVIEIL